MNDMRSIFFCAVAILGIASAHPAMASDFDKCVLQHMQGTTSDLAAVSVKESCLRMVETPLPSEALQTLLTARAGFGQLPRYVGGAGLYVTLNNNSGYTITELTIGIEDKKTHVTVPYVIRLFPFLPPPGAIMVGPPPDMTTIEMIRPGQRQFYTPINETTRDPKKWDDAYAWSLISAKGFRD